MLAVAHTMEKTPLAVASWVAAATAVAHTMEKTPLDVASWVAAAAAVAQTMRWPWADGENSRKRLVCCLVRQMESSDKKEQQC